MANDETGELPLELCSQWNLLHTESVPVYHVKGWGKFNRNYGDFCTGADTEHVYDEFESPVAPKDLIESPEDEATFNAIHNDDTEGKPSRPAVVHSIQVIHKSSRTSGRAHVCREADQRDRRGPRTTQGDPPASAQPATGGQ